MRAGVLVAGCTAATALVLVGRAAAIPVPGWVPPTYKRAYSRYTSNTGYVQFRRLNRTVTITWTGRYGFRRNNPRCGPNGGVGLLPQPPADRRIKVPARARVYGLTGAPTPSLFRGRYVYYRDSGGAREAWACTAGRYPVYVSVYAQGRAPLYKYAAYLPGPRALARMVWSSGST